MQSLQRIIAIWGERSIYDQNLLNEFKKNLKHGKSNESNHHQPLVEKTPVKKRKEEELTIEESPTKKVKATIPLSQSEIEFPIKGEDVDSKELINCLKSLENTASSDAVIRERIAKLPPEVSDSNLIDKLKDKNEAEQLSKQVDEACIILNDYNGRLAKELDDRKKISFKLAAFCRYQKEIQLQAQKTLSEYVERLNKVKRVKSELKSHLKNLPDLTKLPSLKEAPLPKINDLFVSSTAKKENDEKSNDSNEQNVNKNENLAKEDDNFKKGSVDYEITNNSVKV